MAHAKALGQQAVGKDTDQETEPAVERDVEVCYWCPNHTSMSSFKLRPVASAAQHKALVCLALKEMTHHGQALAATPSGIPTSSWQAGHAPLYSQRGGGVLTVPPPLGTNLFPRRRSTSNLPPILLHSCVLFPRGSSMGAFQQRLNGVGWCLPFPSPGTPESSLICMEDLNRCDPLGGAPAARWA